MKITKLSAGKKSNYINVFVDDAYVCNISLNTIAELWIAKGNEISPEEIEQLKNTSLESKLYDGCLQLLARRNHSENELINYLKKQFLKREIKDYDAILQRVIGKLKSNNFLDDLEFTRWWIEQRARASKKSIREISQELYQKGIDKQTIDSVLRESISFDQEMKNCEELAAKKHRQLKSKNYTKQEEITKIKYYLSRKGFSWEEINQAIQKLS